MKKQIVIALALMSLALQTTSCKSKSSQDDTQIVENADVEKIDAEDAALADQSNDLNVGPVDDSLQAALGESPTETVVDPSLTLTDSAMTEPVTTDSNSEITAAPTLDESSINAPPPEIASSTTSDPLLESSGGITEMPESSSPDTSNSFADSSSSITETPVGDSSYQQEPTASYDSSASTSSETTYERPRKSSTSSSASSSSSSGALRKIAETTPYQHGDGWVNTVYIARPKESLKEISQKIYGQDKTKELKKLNSYLSARSPRGGDKIYYVSPNRPTDSAKTLSFYEDTGMIAETYVAKSGDNLRKVAKDLLGYDNAYKEMWTTNAVASKGKLDEGETLRYWRSTSTVTSAPSALADNHQSGAQVIESPNQLPSQPINQMAMNESHTELPPSPPVPDQAQLAQTPDMNVPAMTEPPPQAAMDLPPPPPTPEEIAAMTPPPPASDMAPQAPEKKTPTAMDEEPAQDGALSSDTMTMLGGVVVLCALMAFALIRRNKKKKEAEYAAMSEETHVGT